MFFIYSILLSAAFLLMSPLFLLRRQKYAAGFKQRLGNYAKFENDGRRVIWLHAVSVGEVNAARPLVEKLIDRFPDHRVVVSTTTKTGQDLARKIFRGKASAVFYAPFDWKFSVKRALENYKPSLVLLMETEIWPRFIHEAKKSGAKIAIVNGRLSERSFRRYSYIRTFVAKVLDDIDLALMQGEKDAERMRHLGAEGLKVAVTGNLKFEQTTGDQAELTEELRTRFAITEAKPLIIAASTHEPEERYVIDALEGQLSHTCRLMLAPRHPERFDAIASLLADSPYSFARRSSVPNDSDQSADIILLDSIGELRAAYSLAEIVFVGGSLIPHGGQSVLEPAAEAKAIVTGPYTENFDAVVKEALAHEAIRQTPEVTDDFQISKLLHEEFILLLENKRIRRQLGGNAAAVIQANRGAADRTTDLLEGIMGENN